MSNNLMESISIDRLHSIEREREEIVGSIEFQKWMSELGVSSMWIDPSGSLNGKEMMREYDFKKLDRG